MAILRWQWLEKCVPRILVMLLDQLLWHRWQRNGAAVLSSSLRATMGKSGRVVGGAPIYKGWVPSVRNKESTSILSPI
jgi:hypothetical protein